MLPTANRNQFFLYLDLKEGSDIIRTKEDVLKINSILLENQNILSIESFVGEPAVTDFNGLFKGSNYRNSPNQATLKINLKDIDLRSQKSEDIVSWAREELQRNFSSNNSVSYRILEDPPGPPVVSTFEAKIITENDEVRSDFTNKLTKLVSKIDGVVHTDNSLEEGIYREKINIMYEKASFYNIDLTQVYSILKGTYSITNVSQIKNNFNNEVSFIELTVPISVSSKTNILNDTFVTNKYGQVIPLNKFAEIENTRHESTIISDNKERTDYISAETNQKSIVYVVIELIKKILSNSLEDYYVESWNLYEINLKNESGITLKLEWGGEWEMTLDNFRDLGIAMLIAFFLIFAVLTAQFSNYKTSLIIMSTIPLGFIGILPGFAILDNSYGTFLTATSLIGFIALIGIVVNNAIIYFEYFEQLKEKGKTTKEALILSGTTRFRPILLTSLTTILGSLTIANDPVWSGLAWAIVFGLSVSTILTLFLFPVIVIYKEK
jgi:multidrug efflux pump subunit AcrB